MLSHKSGHNQNVHRMSRQLLSFLLVILHNKVYCYRDNYPRTRLFCLLKKALPPNMGNCHLKIVKQMVIIMGREMPLNEQLLGIQHRPLLPLGGQLHWPCSSMGSPFPHTRGSPFSVLFLPLWCWTSHS